MNLDEVQRTGIRIARRQRRDGRLIFEFIIDWKAAPSLCALKPGMLLGIGVLDEASRREDVSDLSPGGSMGPGAPGGGPGPGTERNHLEIWLQVRLAQQF